MQEAQTWGWNRGLNLPSPLQNWTISSLPSELVLSLTEYR